MKIRSVSFSLALASLLCVIPIAQSGANDAPLHIGRGFQLFVDDWLIDELRAVERVIHEPVRREVALVFDAPWEGPQTAYPTVLRDPGEEFRLYYRGGGDRTTREVTCLATSTDGIHWQRPQLGLVEFKGSTADNIVWTGEWKSYGESHNFSPFVDTNPAAPASERYKAVALRRGLDENGKRHRMLGVLASPDGIHWRRLSDKPVIRQGSFDSLNVAFWDPNIERYVCYSRVGHNGLRSIQRSISSDFLHWSPPTLLEFSPPQSEHYYTNAITLYTRSPGLYLGFPMRFVPLRRAIGFEQRPIDGTSDAVMISSRDGLHWARTFRTAFLRPGPDPANWGNAHGNNTIATGLLKTAPGEISLYWMEHYGAVPRLRRGTLRLDGFVSLRAGAGPGEVLTRPIVFSGNQLVINFSTSAVGSVRVELLDAERQPLEGFSLDDCPEIFGDEFERVVSWAAGPDLSSFRETPIRLRFVLQDADLYSFAIR